jgi:hypothetical protein
MLKIAAAFYKNLFAKEETPAISLDDNSWDSQDLLMDEEASILDTPFYEEEIYNAIMASWARMPLVPWALMAFPFCSTIGL